jgi:hypothetical protein
MGAVYLAGTLAPTVIHTATTSLRAHGMLGQMVLSNLL